MKNAITDEDPVCKRPGCGHSYFYEHAAQGFGERAGKPMRCRVAGCTCPNPVWDEEETCGSPESN